MIPNIWNKDITLYIKTEVNKNVQWERFFFSRCFFKRLVSSQYDDKTRSSGKTYTVRIPCISPPSVTQESIAVLGKVFDVIPENTSGNDLVLKYGDDAFRVVSVSFNTEFPTPHIRIGG